MCMKICDGPLLAVNQKLGSFFPVLLPRLMQDGHSAPITTPCVLVISPFLQTCLVHPVPAQSLVSALMGFKMKLAYVARKLRSRARISLTTFNGRLRIT